MKLNSFGIRSFKTCLPALVALVAVGCNFELKRDDDSSADDSPEVAVIEDALELDDGGLTMDDEAPMFGDKDSFETSDLLQPEGSYDDPNAADPEVQAMKASPDAMVFHTTVLWGQIPGNFEDPTGRRWDGSISVNRGALVLKRLVRFEPSTDQVLPRTDRKTVSFTSVTLPHHDGLYFNIIDPTPEAAEPLTLSYLAADGSTLFQAPVSSLTDGPERQEVDDAGNSVVAVALPRPVDLCQHGMIGGRWHAYKEGTGRFIGVVTDPTGDRIGYMKGLYGQRKNGKRVFFGKYINEEGKFRGIFGGRYENGRFAGRWKSINGDIGGLGGMYRETIPGPEVGGHYLGRWAETSCNVPVGAAPAQAPADQPSPDQQ